MAKIHTLKKNGESIYPMTHMKGVVDDNGNTMDVLLAEAEKRVLRNLYIAAGALYNDTDEVIKRTAFWGEEVDHKPRCYYLNGLGDITEEQMINIYNEKEAITTILTTSGGVDRYFQDYNAPRTLFGHKGYRYSSGKMLSSLYVFSKGIEVVDWAYNSGWLSTLAGVPIISNKDFFFQCNKVYAVNTFKSSVNINFSYSDRIRYFRIYGTTVISLNLAKSTIVDKASVLHFIQNMTVPSTAATSATARTITLHPDVYAKCIEGGEWYEDINTALVAKNEALSAKNYSLNLVSA